MLINLTDIWTLFRLRFSFRSRRSLVWVSRIPVHSTM